MYPDTLRKVRSPQPEAAEPVGFNPVYTRDRADKIRYGYRRLHPWGSSPTGTVATTMLVVVVRDVRVFPVSDDGRPQWGRGHHRVHGDMEGTKQFLDALPQALETSAETVKRALDQTVRELELAEKREAEARDKISRQNFRPHAIILTERTVPSPIFVALEKLLRIDLDRSIGRQLDRLALIRFGNMVSASWSARIAYVSVRKTRCLTFSSPRSCRAQRW